MAVRAQFARPKPSATRARLADPSCGAQAPNPWAWIFGALPR